MQNAVTDPADVDSSVPPATPLALVKHLRGEGFTVVDADRHVPLGQVGDGRQPHAVAQHPGGRWAYVPYMGSNTLEVLDLRDLTVHERVADAGIAPVGATLSRDGRYLFVSTYGGLPSTDAPGFTVYETDPEGGLTLVAERAIGKAAGLVTDARNDVWVALKDANAVVRLDGEPPFEERGRLRVPGDPQTLSLAPAYGLLGVNNVDDGSVTFVDVIDEAVRATVPAPNPRGGQAVPAVDRWFVGNTEGDGVTVVDLDTVRDGDGDRLPDSTRTVELGTPTAFVDARPDGRLVAVDAYEDDRVTFIDPDTLDVVARVEIGGEPHHPRFSADGTVCYIPNQTADSVTVLDTAGAPSDATFDRIADVELPADSAPSGCFRTDRR